MYGKGGGGVGVGRKHDEGDDGPVWCVLQKLGFLSQDLEGHTVVAASRLRPSRSETETTGNVKEELTWRSEEAAGTGGGAEGMSVTRRKEGWQLSQREVSPSDDWSVAHRRRRCTLTPVTNGSFCICTFEQTEKENGGGI